MLLKCSSPQVSMLGRNLKPLSEYSGPILKLTASEKSQISKMESKIAEYELEIEKLARLNRGITRVSSEKAYYNNKMYYLTGWIDDLRNAIREIKINRLNIQKSQMKK